MSRLERKVKLHFKLPTVYNDGTPINPSEFIRVKNYFLDTYGGLSIDNPTTGYWQDSGVTYTDETIEYMVLIGKDRFDKQVKPNLINQIEKFKKRFKQLEILCYYHDVMST